MNALADVPVGEIRTLGSQWQDDPKAKEMLTKAVTTCFPLMRRRGWKVGIVDEFFPKNAGLLGLNEGGGKRIRIRLRKPVGSSSGSDFNANGRNIISRGARAMQQQSSNVQHQDGGFWHFEHVLGTMLHELTHIVRGPHDSTFYRILDEITAEVEKDIASGAADAAGVLKAFDGVGRRLGSNVPRLPDGGNRVPIVTADMRRQQALVAAEKRAMRSLNTAPQRLGGVGVALARSLTPREAAARAAERRAADEKSCGREGQVIDLVGDDDAEDIGLSRRQSSSVRGCDSPSVASSPSPSLQSASVVVDLCGHNADGDRARPTGNDESNFATKRRNLGYGRVQAETENVPSVAAGRFWDCGACTLTNEASASRCSACDTARVTPSSFMAAALNLSWACSMCTLQNSVRLALCSACGNQRPRVSGGLS